MTQFFTRHIITFRDPASIRYSLRPRNEIEYAEDSASENEEDNVEEEEHHFSEEDCEQSDEENSESENNELEVTSSTRKKRYILGKDGRKWSKDPGELRSRQRCLERLQMHFPCVRLQENTINCPLDAWNLLINTDMIELIVEWTNAEIRKSWDSMTDEAKQNSWIKEVDFDEVRAFFGILYFAGAEQRSSSNVRDLFSTEYGSFFYSSVMPINRFNFLAAKLRFENKETRQERQTEDRFAAIRDL